MAGACRPKAYITSTTGSTSDEGSMVRVAVVTDDGKTVSRHFGSSTQYIVYEIHSGAIKGRETRPKAAHGPGVLGTHDHASMHEKMLSNVKDCEALIAGGMGSPMYEAIKESGIRPFLTEIVSAEDAVRAYLQGTLDDHLEKLH